MTVDPLSLFEDFESLSSFLTLETVEIHPPSAYYGIAKTLKKFAGAEPSVPLKANVEHGLFYGEEYWQLDIDAPLPRLWTLSERRACFLRKIAKKPVDAIGPYIAYAKPHLSPEQTQQVRKELGKTFLFFPAHSTQWHHSHLNFDSLVNKLHKIKEEFHFDQILVCLYWKDAMDRKAEFFQNAGFRCVTAGHMYDPQFLPRLKSLIEISTVAGANDIGTGLGYAVFLNRPFWYVQEKTYWTIPDDPNASHIPKTVCTLEKGNIMHEINETTHNKLRNLFTPNVFQITKEQRALVSEVWGFEQSRTQQELSDLLKLAESEFSKKKLLYQYKIRIRPLIQKVRWKASKVLEHFH